MVPSPSHTYRHDQEHDPGDHGHGHVHAHAHGLASPHPAQAARWSILRMTLVERVAAALAVSAGLWGIVWLAMR
jgi:hypothetical protein